MQKTAFWQCHSSVFFSNFEKFAIRLFCSHALMSTHKRNDLHQIQFSFAKKLKSHLTCWKFEPICTRQSWMIQCGSFVDYKVQNNWNFSLLVFYQLFIYTLRMAFDWYCCILFTFVATQLSHEIIAVFVTSLYACICLYFIYNLLLSFAKQTAEEIERTEKRENNVENNLRFRYFRASIWLWIFMYTLNVNRTSLSSIIRSTTIGINKYLLKYICVKQCKSVISLILYENV